MHFFISKSALQGTVNIASNIVEKKSTLPILGHVLLKADSPDGIVINATDLDTSLVRYVEAQVKEQGQVALPAILLRDIVRRLPDSQLIEVITEENKRTTVKCGSSVYHLSSLAGEDFPTINISENYPSEFTLKAKELARLLTKTRFAMSTEETRYNLNGIYFHCIDVEGKPHLRAVATDSHRLACAQTPLSKPLNIEGLIISRKTVNELARLLDDCAPDDDVKILLSSYQICFHLWGSTYVSSRLIDGVFPDYEQFIPYDNEKVIMLEKEKFKEAVERVSLISNEKERPVKLLAANNNLHVESLDADLGKAEEDVEADCGAEEVNVFFNSRYLLDLSYQISDDVNMEIKVGDPGAPVIFQEVGNKNELSVIMPLRL